MTAVAGGVVAATDITNLTALTTAKPLVRLVANSTQSIPHNTATALTFAGEDIDTHGFHSTSSNTSRITPSVAGYYTARGIIAYGARSDYLFVDAFVRKNGSTNVAPSGRHGNGPATGQSSQFQTAPTWALVQFDGVSDYVELMALQQNNAAAAQVTNQSSQFSSVFELVFERSL